MRMYTCLATPFTSSTPLQLSLQAHGLEYRCASGLAQLSSASARGIAAMCTPGTKEWNMRAHFLFALCIILFMILHLGKSCACLIVFFSGARLDVHVCSSTSR